MRDRVLRGRQDETRDRLGRLPPPPPTRSGVQVCRTVAGDEPYPTAPNRFYLVVPLAETGPETEGGAVSFSDRLDGSFLAAHVGANVPPVGARVIVFHAEGVGFVFEY